MNKNSPIKLLALFRKTGLRRGTLFGIILLVAMFAFEVFNFTTTEFALSDLLGKDLLFLGVRWATILAVAFCGIDFAGVARLFTPEQGPSEPAEVWYLFGAWILAAGMNASLTWWGVAVAISDHSTLGSAIIGHETLTRIVPIFVAVLVWIIRILLIGTFSMAGERIFSMVDDRAATHVPAAQLGQSPVHPASPSRPLANNSTSRPQTTNPSRPVRPEPSYHPVGMAAKPRDDDQASWR